MGGAAACSTLGGTSVGREEGRPTTCARAYAGAESAGVTVPDGDDPSSLPPSRLGRVRPCLDIHRRRPLPPSFTPVRRLFWRRPLPLPLPRSRPITKMQLPHPLPPIKAPRQQPRLPPALQHLLPRRHPHAVNHLLQRLPLRERPFPLRGHTQRCPADAPHTIARERPEGCDEWVRSASRPCSKRRRPKRRFIRIRRLTRSRARSRPETSGGYDEEWIGCCMGKRAWPAREGCSLWIRLFWCCVCEGIFEWTP